MTSGIEQMREMHSAERTAPEASYQEILAYPRLPLAERLWVEYLQAFDWLQQKTLSTAGSPQALLKHEGNIHYKGESRVATKIGDMLQKVREADISWPPRILYFSSNPEKFPKEFRAAGVADEIRRGLIAPHYPVTADTLGTLKATINKVFRVKGEQYHYRKQHVTSHYSVEYDRADSPAENRSLSDGELGWIIPMERRVRATQFYGERDGGLTTIISLQETSGINEKISFEYVIAEDAIKREPVLDSKSPKKPIDFIPKFEAELPAQVTEVEVYSLVAALRMDLAS